MHTLEPFYNWRTYYTAEEDPKSPFYGREYSEFEFTNTLYNHCIHPQWDPFGSPTLFLKILYTDYLQGFVVMELLGEWNDCLHNDIMFLKRDIADAMMEHGIHKFILIGENVLNFHYSDDCYYEEWFEDVSEEGGWVVLLNFEDHVIREFEKANVDSYFMLGGHLNTTSWRTMSPAKLFLHVNGLVNRRFLSA